MSSVVYYKFKSQKEPSRVTFDGTGISVFELKREIILRNNLGDGTDFDLSIYNSDNNEEYVDDTDILPRSSSVTVRRLPPARPGKGTAVRYVSGRMPQAALSGSRPGHHRAPVGPRTRQDVPQQPGAPPVLSSTIDPAKSEEDRINDMFQAQGQQWKHTQDQMATATRVYSKQNSKNVVNTPEYPPPAGYVCYRCGEKGHWIQACPTNNDPNFEGKRIKRTTGIPRSFLKTVAKPSADDDSTNGGSVMVNAEGEYVVAMPDSTSWDTYQMKANAAAKDLQDKPNDETLQDPISHKLMNNPVKTPCCGKVYSEDSIQQALLDSDFVCPNCGREEILLDQLKPDEEISRKIDEYKKKNEIIPVGGNTSLKRSRSPQQEIENNNQHAAKRIVPDNNNNSLKSESPVMNAGSSREQSVKISATNTPPLPPPPAPVMGGNFAPMGGNNYYGGGQFMQPYGQPGIVGGYGGIPYNNNNQMMYMNGFTGYHPQGYGFQPQVQGYYGNQHLQQQQQQQQQDDGGAYMRTALNPQRAYKRENRYRPSDFKELM